VKQRLGCSLGGLRSAQWSGACEGLVNVLLVEGHDSFQTRLRSRTWELDADGGRFTSVAHGTRDVYCLWSQLVPNGGTGNFFKMTASGLFKLGESNLSASLLEWICLQGQAHGFPFH